MSEESKQKLRASKKGKGNGRLGTKHTEETKEKMRLARVGKNFPIPDNKGRKHSDEFKEKVSLANKKRFQDPTNHPMYGKKFSAESKQKMSESHLGQIPSNATRKKLSEAKRGSKHWNWKTDRSSLKKSDKKHLCGHYKQWMLDVKSRDGWKCMTPDNDCKGRMEAHHIKNWCDYPNLRYKLNNGITLCHNHHPRGRLEEKRLEPIFLKILEDESSDSIKRHKIVTHRL